MNGPANQLVSDLMGRIPIAGCNVDQVVLSRKP